MAEAGCESAEELEHPCAFSSMNTVEMEETASGLASQSFDAAEFASVFLRAFGNKKITIDRLRKGSANKLDANDALQRNNIKVAAPGEVGAALNALRKRPANR